MLEQCRLACGGHGYSLTSGFHRLFVGIVGAVTAEGEHTVLHLQTGRYGIESFEMSVNNYFDYPSNPMCLKQIFVSSTFFLEIKYRE